MNPYLLIDKYYKDNLPLKELLIVHSEAVRDKALWVVDKHPEFNVDRSFVAEAAMIHDIGIFMTKAEGIYCFGDAPYIAHGYLGADLMRKEGYNKHALVCERHTGTGLSLDTIVRRNLPIPHRDMCPESLEEEIICFADKFFTKSHLETELNVEEVQEALSRFGEEVVTQFNKWCVRFL